jgi:hypothetical protein
LIWSDQFAAENRIRFKSINYVTNVFPEDSSIKGNRAYGNRSCKETNTVDNQIYVSPVMVYGGKL